MRQQLLPCRGNPNLYCSIHITNRLIDARRPWEIGHAASNLFVGARACTQARGGLASTAHDRFAVVIEGNYSSPS
jgi:hypothetical protein